MNAIAPTPAEKSLRRVLLISGIDGWSVIAIAGLGSLLALMLGDLSGAFTGLLIIAAGVIELRGRARLQRRDAGGMISLVRAQLFLLAVILIYCVTRLASFDEGLVQQLVQENLTPDMEAALREGGLARADIVPAVKLMFYAVYGTVVVASLLCQGGLMYYYRSRTARVAEALSAPPPPLG